MDDYLFDLYYKAFVDYVETESGQRFNSFPSNSRTQVEDYKLELYREGVSQLGYRDWSDDHIGLGKIVGDTIRAIEIPDNNLLEWDSRRGADARPHSKMHAAGEFDLRKPIEQAIYNLYRSDDAERSFEVLVDIFGKKYGLLGYLFFLKDRSQFMPIATTYFDAAFRLLGIDLKTTRQCSWENYRQYNQALFLLRDGLQSRMVAEVTLLDAHSFAWILAHDMSLNGGLPDSQSYRNLPATERASIQKSRIGQGRFREALERYWKCCAVTGCTEQAVLRASHIKPWSESSDTEKLDVYNGLLLSAGIDACFDKGLISFSDSGSILISESLSLDDRDSLGLHGSLKIQGLDDRHRPYLEFHRKKNKFR